ncbi:unnamed protein product [Medioppia subpectinata]|nr:unnamed protein product [Medioppia subpectinata]CAG2109351.1 unnamed protein product [Medioppia subpectinata]
MNNAYNKDLIKVAKHCAQGLGLKPFLREGVYVMTGGPTYETIAEIRFLVNYGDAIGMSTAHEVTVAHHCGLRVFGLSLITNQCISDYESKSAANHEEVLEAAKGRAKDLEIFIETLVENFNKYDLFLQKSAKKSVK